MTKQPLPTFTQATAVKKIRLTQDGLMQRRIASTDERVIAQTGRERYWPLSRCLDGHPDSTEL